MRNKNLFISIVILLLVVVADLLNSIVNVTEPPIRQLTVNATANSNAQLVKAQLGNYQLVLELVLTPEARERGLSNRLNPTGDGMLFVFPQRQTATFWNPNMKFPLEVFWITGQQVIGSALLPVDNGQRLTALSPEAVDMVLELPQNWRFYKEINFPAIFRVDKTLNNGMAWLPLVR